MESKVGDDSDEQEVQDAAIKENTIQENAIEDNNDEEILST